MHNRISSLTQQRIPDQNSIRFLLSSIFFSFSAAGKRINIPNGGCESGPRIFPCRTPETLACCRNNDDEKFWTSSNKRVRSPFVIYSIAFLFLLSPPEPTWTHSRHKECWFARTAERFGKSKRARNIHCDSRKLSTTRKSCESDAPLQN